MKHLSAEEIDHKICKRLALKKTEAAMSGTFNVKGVQVPYRIDRELYDDGSQRVIGYVNGEKFSSVGDRDPSALKAKMIKHYAEFFKEDDAQTIRRDIGLSAEEVDRRVMKRLAQSFKIGDRVTFKGFGPELKAEVTAKRNEMVYDVKLLQPYKEFAEGDVIPAHVRDLKK